MQYLKTSLLLIAFVLVLGGMGCGDTSSNNPIGAPNPKPDGAILPEPGVGFGVSGLLFNNNLVLYDRARSDLNTFDLVLIPQMYFTNIEVSDFPVYGSFPRDQIVSGGVKIDDISAITNPTFVDPDGAGFLNDNDLVIGLTLNGEPRAYPHNILWWHEIINDENGGQRISVTFCPLTGTGLVFDVGTPRDRLAMIPAVESTWGRWRQLHPETKVVDRSNSRLSSIGSYPYGNYRSDNTAPLFPINRAFDTRFPPKRMIHGILIDGRVPRAYPFSSLGSKTAINDRFADTDILVVFDQAGQMALSYDRTVDRRTLTFAVVEEGAPFRLQDRETGTTWTVDGRAVQGPLTGQTLSRIQNAYNAFWFAWAAFWPATSVYTP